MEVSSGQSESVSSTSNNDGETEDARNYSRDTSEDLMVDESESPYFHVDYMSSPPGFSYGSPPARTPPNLQSNSSLYGEDIVNSTRLSASTSSAGGGGSYLLPRQQPQDGDIYCDDDEDDRNNSRPDDNHDEFLFSPSALSAVPSEATTPPLSAAAPPSLTPPPLNPESVVSFSSRNSARKRPPRAPPNHARLDPQQQQRAGGSSIGSRPQLPTHRHMRTLSQGDSSLLSALTDASQEPSRHHRRHVSWDNNTRENSSKHVVYGMNIAIPSSLQQPVLVDDQLQQPILEAPMSTPESVVATTPTSTTTPRGAAVVVDDRSSSSPRRSLTEQVTEFENEAETHILRAVEEEMTQQKHDVATKKISRLLPYIPDMIPQQDRFEQQDKKDGLEHPEYYATGHDNAEATACWRGRSTRKKSELSSSVIHYLCSTKILHKENLERGIFNESSQVLTSEEIIEDEPQHAGDELVRDYQRMYQATSQLRQRKRSDKSRRRAVVNDSSAAQLFLQPTSSDRSSLRDGASQVDNSNSPLAAAEEGVSPVKAAAQQARKIGAVGEQVLHHLEDLESDWNQFGDFLRPRRQVIWSRIRSLCVILIFCLSVAAGLFYGAGNPPTGRKSDHNYEEKPTYASVSWWLIFICRHILVFVLAAVTEAIVVDFMALSSSNFIRLVGPKVTLFIASSKGWPSILFSYGSFSIVLLYGRDKFAKNWLFWQDAIDLFTDDNPSGNITSRNLYARCLMLCLVLGLAVSLKRLWMGHHLGQRLLSRYRDRLTNLVRKMSTISEVASQASSSGSKKNALVEENHDDKWCPPIPELHQNGSDGHTPSSGTPDRSNKRSEVARNEWVDVLEEWNEPDRNESKTPVTTEEILLFRQAFEMISTGSPFSLAFGPANSRMVCVDSSSALFDRLLKIQSNGELLRFETFVRILGGKGRPLSKQKTQELVELFRSNRRGELSRVEFVQSIDAVYREMRVLAANVENATKMDSAYERLMNVAFYLVLGATALPLIGIDPLPIILSLTGLLVTFAFVIGAASSSYFEGILLILARRPYEIGDRIAISDVNQDAPPQGSNGWVVENIDLFSTHIRYEMTREVASVSNGSLARSRIINMKRSDSAQVMIYLKFGVDVPFQRVKVFRRAVERFVRDRNNEWKGMLAFRSTDVRSDLGYIEYCIVLEARESWQQVGSVLNSKASVSSFCLELQKQLDMRYEAPPLPVNLNVASSLAAVRGQPRTEDQCERDDPPSDRVNTDDPGASPNVSDEGIMGIARLFETTKAK